MDVNQDGTWWTLALSSWTSDKVLGKRSQPLFVRPVQNWNADLDVCVFGALGSCTTMNGCHI